MNPLIQSNVQSKQEEYEHLLFLRDQCKKDAEDAQRRYNLIFGALMNAVYEKQISCIQLKKYIALLRIRQNKGEQINVSQIQSQMHKEMDPYWKRMEQMASDYEENKKQSAKATSEDDIKESKRLYREIAKRIHPDINPKSQIAEVQPLWDRAQIAYRKNDSKELAEILTMINKVLLDHHLDGQRCITPNLDKKIAELKKEIDIIQCSDPYRYLALLKDEKAVEEKKQQLQTELDKYIRYELDLTKTFESLLKIGGITWNTR